MNLFKFFKKAPNPKVELTLDKEGWYVVKAYGQFMSTTLTKDKEEAERNFEYVIDRITNGVKDERVTIKEAYIK